MEVGVKNGFDGGDRSTFEKNCNLNETVGGVHSCAPVLLTVNNWDYKQLTE